MTEITVDIGKGRRLKTNGDGTFRIEMDIALGKEVIDLTLKESWRLAEAINLLSRHPELCKISTEE